MKLSSLGVPFVCLVLSEPSVEDCIRLIDAHEKDVDAFEVNIPPLDPLRLRDVFQSTSRPFIVTNRRAAFMRFYGYARLPTMSETERAAVLERAIGLGADAADFELDIFTEGRRSRARPMMMMTTTSSHAGPRARALRRKPAEFSREPEAMKRQTDLATAIRSQGGEVIISCHTQTVLDEDDALEIVRAIEGRGGQFAKVVSLTSHEGDLIEMLRCATVLKRRSAIPFTVMNVGWASVLGRLASTMAGSSWVYCRAPEAEHGYAGQPTLDDARWFLKETGLVLRPTGDPPGRRPSNRSCTV